MGKMRADERILQELRRYNQINKYILEQEAGELPPPPDSPPVDPLAAADPAAGATPPPPGGVPPAPGAPAAGAEATPIDPATDPDVEKIGPEGKTDEEGAETEELDITDLVTSQKNVEEKQEEYFKNLFSQLETLQGKLGEMDKLVSKIDSLEAKVEKYRPKTAQEKLELRSLDSGPYNQKLSDFFVDKEEEMEKSGKNEYVLTTDEVKDFTPSEVRDSFRDFPGNERPVEVR
jgi:hypothetical protein